MNHEKKGNMPQEVHEPFRPDAGKAMQRNISDGLSSEESDRAGLKFYMQKTGTVHSRDKMVLCGKWVRSGFKAR